MATGKGGKDQWQWPEPGGKQKGKGKRPQQGQSSGSGGAGTKDDWSHKKRQLKFLMQKDFDNEKLAMRQAFDAEKEEALREQRQCLDKEKAEALEALAKSYDLSLKVIADDCQLKLETATKNVSDALARAQQIQADAEEKLLNVEAEHQLELTKKDAVHAKALQELHDTHMATVKTVEDGYKRQVRRKHQQVEELMGQVTDVNNFVQEYYKKYGLAKYRRPESSEAPTAGKVTESTSKEVPKDRSAHKPFWGSLIAFLLIRRKNQHNKKQHVCRTKSRRTWSPGFVDVCLLWHCKGQPFMLPRKPIGHVIIVSSSNYAIFREII